MTEKARRHRASWSIRSVIVPLVLAFVVAGGAAAQSIVVSAASSLTDYTLAYATFMALPLLFVDEALLWKAGPEPRRRSIPFYWLLGFVLALAIRIFWGLVYSPIATSLFQLPPNP